MHSFGKKIFWVIILLLVGNAHAQNTMSASAKVSLTVVKSLNVRSSANLSFSHNSPQNGVFIISPKDKKAGRFILEGKPGSKIMISIPNTITLCETKGNNIYKISNRYAYNTKNNQQLSRLVGHSHHMATHLNAESGKLYVWIGEEINFNRMKPGNYNGEYTATISYLDQ